ncbi:hypothetical protein Tco_1355781, partial [Tanacetum coccineum]
MDLRQFMVSRWIVVCLSSLCDGGEPRRLWLDAEDGGGGWIRMAAAAVTTANYPFQ